MSIDIWLTSTFVRELKRLKKAHYPIHLITKCLSSIINDNKEKRIQMKDHQLKGAD